MNTSIIADCRLPIADCADGAFRRRRRSGLRTCVAIFILQSAICNCIGCASSKSSSIWDWDVAKPSVQLPAPPKEEVLRAGHWELETPLQPGTLGGDFASAKVLFDRAEYADAEKVFHWLAHRAEKEKNPAIYEECLFHEAECLYALREWPKARDTYYKLLKEFPSSRYRNEAIRRQYDIVQYWLVDTRKEQEEDQKKIDGTSTESWFTMPQIINFEKEKPTFDEEGFALKGLEAIYTQDPAGPLAPAALYQAGGLSFYREHYKDADDYYSLLVESYPKSPLAPQALELALQSKIQVTGGPNYDSRKLVEARDLIDKALRSYPEVKNNPEKREALQNTLVRINNQQAEKDFNIAEFYRRTDHPGAAYFQYEIVRRRYPGTEWASRATERVLELRDKVESGSADKK